MITLCIRYTIDPHKHADFEAYARAWRSPVERCGGKFFGYFLPTKVAGSTNTACVDRFPQSRGIRAVSGSANGG